MPNPLRLSLLAGLVALAAAPAMAGETLRCRSVNGNVTCAGSGSMSCQTVDGRTTCVGGNGAVVQQFGGAGPRQGRPAPPPAPGAVAGPEGPAEAPPARDRRGQDGRRRLFIERHGPDGRLTLERDGTRLRLRSERLVLDTD